MNNIIVSGKKGNTWLWVVIIIIVLVVLFFLFRSPSPEKEKIGAGTSGEKVAGGGAVNTGDIGALDIGENPDVGVDDFNSLQVSSEEITG